MKAIRNILTALGLTPLSALDKKQTLLTTLLQYINISGHILFIIVLDFCLLVMPTSSQANTNILILQSHDSPPFQQALDGFKSYLTSKGIDAEYETHIITNETEAEQLWPTIQGHQQKLILTLGTPATRAVLNREHTIPVVANLVLDTGDLKKSNNVTGVGLTFPAAMEIQWLQKLLPAARQIVLIYDPKHSSSQFQALQRLAQAENISITPAPASTPEDIANLLQNIPSQSDAIWAIDASAFNPISVRELLLYSFRNRTPLIGLSAQSVKAGAFYALDWDYNDLGVQAAELAWSILSKGTPASAIPIQFPRKVRPVLNSKTAEHMNIPISEQWLPEISEIFR